MIKHKRKNIIPPRSWNDCLPASRLACPIGRRRAGGTGGLTLVEIIVAALLLAIISAGMFSVTLSSRKLTSRAQRRHFATEVAQTVLENLRAYLGADHWDNDTPIDPGNTSLFVGEGGWSNWYNIETHTFLNIKDRFGNSEFATRYGGRWRYRVEDVDSYDYRKAEVEVDWDETQL